MDCATLKDLIEASWPGRARCRFDPAARTNEVTCERAVLADVCSRLFHEWDYAFAGLVVEEGERQWELRYVFTASATPAGSTSWSRRRSRTASSPASPSKPG